MSSSYFHWSNAAGQPHAHRGPASSSVTDAPNATPIQHASPHHHAGSSPSRQNAVASNSHLASPQPMPMHYGYNPPRFIPTTQVPQTNVSSPYTGWNDAVLGSSPSWRNAGQPLSEMAPVVHSPELRSYATTSANHYNPSFAGPSSYSYANNPTFNTSPGRHSQAGPSRTNKLSSSSRSHPYLHQVRNKIQDPAPPSAPSVPAMDKPKSNVDIDDFLNEAILQSKLSDYGLSSTLQPYGLLPQPYTSTPAPVNTHLSPYYSSPYNQLTPLTPELTSSVTSPSSDFACDPYPVSSPYSSTVSNAPQSPARSHEGAYYYSGYPAHQPPAPGLQLYVPQTSTNEQQQPVAISKKRKNRDDDGHEGGAEKQKRPRQTKAPKGSTPRKNKRNDKTANAATGIIGKPEIQIKENEVLFNGRKFILAKHPNTTKPSEGEVQKEVIDLTKDSDDVAQRGATARVQQAKTKVPLGESPRPPPLAATSTPSIPAPNVPSAVVSNVAIPSSSGSKPSVFIDTRVSSSPVTKRTATKSKNAKHEAPHATAVPRLNVVPPPPETGIPSTSQPSPTSSTERAQSELPILEIPISCGPAWDTAEPSPAVTEASVEINQAQNVPSAADALFVELVARAGAMDESARSSYFSITGQHLPTTLPAVQVVNENETEPVTSPEESHEPAEAVVDPEVKEVPLVLEDTVFKGDSPSLVPESFAELILSFETDAYGDWNLPWGIWDDGASSSTSSTQTVEEPPKQDSINASATEGPQEDEWDQVLPQISSSASTSSSQMISEFDASLDGKTREDGMQSVFQRTVYKYDYRCDKGKGPVRAREQTPLKKAFTREDLARGDH